MRINVQPMNLRSRDGLNRWVEEKILALGEARQIDEANVRLECRFESSPPFAVCIHLVTPGPDIFAESRDHTLRAAFTKALAQLRESIAGRSTKRLRRLKSNSSALESRQLFGSLMEQARSRRAACTPTTPARSATRPAR